MISFRKHILAGLAALVLASAFWAQIPGWAGTQLLHNGSHNGYGSSSVVDGSGNLISFCNLKGHSFLEYPQEDPLYSSAYNSWLWKQDPAGNTIWTRRLSSTQDFQTLGSIGVDIYQNIYITGSFYGSVTLGSTTLTAPHSGRFVGKLNSQGEWLWVREINGIAPGTLMEFAVGLDGSCFFTGYSRDPLVFDTISLDCGGWEDMFIARMSSQGAWIWARMATGFREMRGCFLAPAPSGGCYVAGETTGLSNFGEFSFTDGDFFVASYNAAGICDEVEIIDEWWIGYHAHFEIRDLVRTSAGQVLLLYEYDETGADAHRSVCVAKCFVNSPVPPDDFFVSGISGFAKGIRMDVDNAGNIYLLGSHQGPYTFFNSTITLPAERGLILAKLNQFGELLWACDPSPNEYDYNNFNLHVAFWGHIYLTLTTSDNYTVGQFQTAPGIETYNTAGATSNGEISWMRSSWCSHVGSNGMDVFQNQDGSVFLCGNYLGDFIRDGLHYTSFSPQANDVYVAKLEESGTLAWISTAGGSGEDGVEAMWVDTEQNIFITGYFENTMQCGPQNLVSAGGKDIFVAKLDGWGNWLWAVSYGGTEDDIGTDIIGEGMGNICITATFRASLVAGAQILTALGGSDGMVLKLDSSGMPLGAVSGGGIGNDRFSGLSLKPDAEIVVCGGFEGIATFGTEQLVSSGDADVMAGRLDSQLNWIDCWSSGSEEMDEATGIDCDSTGNLYITGVFSGYMSIAGMTLDHLAYRDIFLAKADPQGNWIWGLGWGYYGNDHSAAIVVSPFGVPYITGYVKADHEYSVYGVRQNILTAAASPEGVWLWAKQSGPTWYLDEDYANSLPAGNGIAIHSGGHCIVTGTYKGSMALGNTYLSVGGDYNTFVGYLLDGVPVDDQSILGMSKMKLWAAPNPFAQKTTISLDLKEGGEVSLKVYNIRGQLVQTLHKGKLERGTHHLEWNGCDFSGHACSRGIYLIKASQGSQNRTMRVIRM